jgi:hypothetical protein
VAVFEYNLDKRTYSLFEKIDGAVVRILVAVFTRAVQ